MNDIDCYICTTPFQVFTSINLQKMRNNDSDIYIINQFDCLDLISSLKEEKIFTNVIYIDESEYLLRTHEKGIYGKLKNYFNLFLMYINMDQIVKKIIIGNKKYTSLFISSKAFIGRLICLFFFKNSYEMKYNYFDDGIGSYCNDSLYRVSFFDKVCRYIILGPKKSQIKFSYSLYRADLYNMMHMNNKNEINTIKIMKNSVKNKDIVKRVFNLSNYSNISEKFIFFDSIRSLELTEEGNSKLNEILTVITKSIGENEILIKSHPRDKSKSIYESKIKNIPFEAICFGSSQNEKVFITTLSTAVFTPKLLFNQEPTIIFLNGLLRDHLRYTFDIDILINNFVKLYEKENIFVPKTVNELIEILKVYQ